MNERANNYERIKRKKEGDEQQEKEVEEEREKRQTGYRIIII